MSNKMALDALKFAEAALADIGDADREPGDDLAWCEARAAEALPQTRAAIAALQAEPQPKEGATDGLTPEQVRKVCADAERFLGATTNVIDFGLIGSAAWLPQPKDVDYIVLIEDSDERGPDFSVTAFCNALLPQGFENCGDYEMAMNGWNAVRRDDLNLIVTAVEDSYHAYRKAMIVCQALNLTDKKDRRMVCRILRDDLSLDEAKDKWNTEAQIEAAAQPSQAPVVQAVQPTQAVRMLTDDEQAAIIDMHSTGRAQGDHECAEAIQRKFCEVNKLPAPSDGEIGGA